MFMFLKEMPEFVRGSYALKTVTWVETTHA